MNKIILITGGERSGKSSFAEQTALSLSPNPVYMATARVWDDEFRERVRRHQLRRGPEWTNIEEEINLSRHDVHCGVQTSSTATSRKLKTTALGLVGVLTTSRLSLTCSQPRMPHSYS